MLHSPDPNRHRVVPGRCRAIFSPTFLFSVAGCGLFFVSFFLPHASTPLAELPIELAGGAVTGRGKTMPLLALAVLWPYAYAAATATTLLELALRRPNWVRQGLLALPMAALLGLATTWLLLLFGGPQSSRLAIGIAALVAPLAMCVIARMGWLCGCDRYVTAASWGHSLIGLLAIFSIRWCWLPAPSELASGGYLAVAGALLMIFSSWLWPSRAVHDLSDRAQSPARFQFSTSQLVIAATLTAIAYTYWRALHAWNHPLWN